MAFVLTPRFAPTYQAPQCSPFGFCAPASRPAYSYRVARPRPQRPQYSSFNHFFGQIDELLSEIDREAQRQAQLEAERQAHIEAQRESHRLRQLRKRALRARFGVSQTEQGWQVDGEFRGFNQENISIEITDENTLKIAGNTEWQSEKIAQAEQQPAIIESASAVAEKQQPSEQAPEEKMNDVTLNEPDFENVADEDSATVRSIATDSETESHKSHQATVEDDFEDLGAETSPLISSPSQRPSAFIEINEPKGKEEAVKETSAVVTKQPNTEALAQQQEQEPQKEEPVHGSFERTFRFPERIDAANVSASFKDGTLQISVPKAQAQPVRRIAIL